jgi:hypothetical protein
MRYEMRQNDDGRTWYVNGYEMEDGTMRRTTIADELSEEDAKYLRHALASLQLCVSALKRRYAAKLQVEFLLVGD